ncbi:MAG: hypothetical protein HQK75_10135 [Candidatus Magnetomorum sp.]|nr:hypothetical protein [Candidatus Magnetomorum sp.]
MNYRGAILIEKNAAIYAESFGLLKRDTWYHLAATYDGSAIKTYKNGVLIAINTNLSGNPTECDMPFTLGTNFTGLIADVRLWHVALSDTQIQSQMHQNLNTTESNLVLNWLFNAGKDDFVADLSMNDRHGQLIDMPSDTWSVMDAENYTPSTQFLFHNTDVSMEIDSKESASVNVTKMLGVPHNPPKQFEGVFLSQYWVIDYFGSAPFSASITFTVAETIIQQDLDVSCSIKLLRRDETSGGLWKIAGCSSTIDAQTHSIRIDNITQGGQYILGRTNGIPVAGSGKAVAFAGNETNFVIRDLFENIPESLTIEWFMNPSAIDNASKSFQISALDQPGTFSFHTSADGAMTIGSDLETAIKTSTDEIIPNTWQHIAFTYEQGIGKLYKNGTLIQTRHGMTGSLPWKGLVGKNISGQLDELRVWNIARTESDIRSNIYIPLTGNETGLVSYYQLDQPSSLNLMDTKDLFHGDIQYPDSVTYILSTAWATRIVNSNGALSIKAGYDYEGSLQTSITDQPSHGNISINNTDAVITYTVENNYSGTDVFSYEISDGLETDAYTITILTNSLPQISEFPEEIKVSEGITSFSVPFQLTDLDTHIDLLNIQIESSDQSIIDPSDIIIDGTGVNRDLLIQTQRCKAGFVTLNLMVDDGYARTEKEIRLLVESAYHDGPGGICSTENSIALWLKADSITDLLNGTPISTWNDMSHNKNHVSQSESKYRPVYRTNQISQLPTISFDGLDDFLSQDYSGTVPLNELSLFSVARFYYDKVKDETQSIFTLGEHIRKGIRMGCLDSESSYQPVIKAYHRTTERIFMHSQAMPENAFHSISAILHTNQTLFDIDTQMETETYTELPGQLDYGQSLKLRIGSDIRQDALETSFAKSDIAEVIMYDAALSKAQMTIIQTYLNVKYGLSTTRQDLDLTDYTNELCGIGQESDGSSRVFYSGGLIVRDDGFVTDDGDYLYAAHNGNPIIETPDHTPAHIHSRWDRVWKLSWIDIQNNGGLVEVAFDTSAANISTMPIYAGLLGRNNENEDFAEISVLDKQFSVNEIRFKVNISDVQNYSYLTLGMNPGFAIAFDAAGYLESNHFERPYSMTVCAWIKLTDTGSGEIISWTDAQNNYQAALLINNGFLSYVENSHALNGSIPLSENAWTHVAVSKNGNSVTLFVNGQLDAADTNLHETILSEKLIIGQFLQGVMDNPVIWNQALSADQIRISMRQMQTDQQSSLIAYWPINDPALVNEIISGQPANMINTRLIVSDAPLSTGKAIAFTEQAGNIQFDDVGIRLKYHEENSAQVIISKIDRAPSVVPQTKAKILAGQYWIVDRFGSGNVDVDISFTVAEDLVENDRYVKLFHL